MTVSEGLSKIMALFYFLNGILLPILTSLRDWNKSFQIHKNVNKLTNVKKKHLNHIQKKRKKTY